MPEKRETYDVLKKRFIEGVVELTGNMMNDLYELAAEVQALEKKSGVDELAAWVEIQNKIAQYDKNFRFNESGPLSFGGEAYLGKIYVRTSERDTTIVSIVSIQEMALRCREEQDPAFKAEREKEREEIRRQSGRRPEPPNCGF